MTKYLVQKFFWLREKSLIQISQKTLVSLFPFFLFSGIIRVIALSVFSDRGYIHQLTCDDQYRLSDFFRLSNWADLSSIQGQ